MEEVGFDMKDRAFDDQYLERDLNGQLIRVYIVKQVPLDTKFAAKTKNEIKVSFFPLSADIIIYFFFIFRKCVGFVFLICHVIDVILHLKLH